MSLTVAKNFAKATVSTTYDAVAVSIDLTAGHGSRFADPATEGSFPATWYNATDYPDPADDPNREIVTVTARSGDTLTVTRGAEGTGASTKNTAGKTYKMIAGITAAMWDALETQNLPQTFRGLRLGTHLSSDLALYQVLFSAECIVMNDGEAVSDWDNIVADLTASGAGGLDTGSEASSVWYEVFAIYNGTTKSACLHRSRDWFLDLDITANEDASQGIRSAVDNSTVGVAQGITPVTAGKLVMIDVKLLKTGSPTGTLWFELRSNSAGVPSSTVLASTRKIDVSRLTTTATQVRIPFLVPYSVSASTLYHIVAQGSWSVSATDYVNWRMDGSAAAYAGGSKSLYDSDTTTWTADTDDDMWLKCYIERNNVAFSTTAPSGYRYAKIGYAYNGSGGDLLAFVQQDRIWNLSRPITDGLVINETAASLTFTDGRIFWPAMERGMITFALTGTGAATAAATLGDIRCTDLVHGSAGNAGTQRTLYSAFGSAEVIGTSSEILLSMNAFYIDAASGADLYFQGFNW